MTRSSPPARTRNAAPSCTASPISAASAAATRTEGVDVRAKEGDASKQGQVNNHVSRHVTGRQATQETRVYNACR